MVPETQLHVDSLSEQVASVLSDPKSALQMAQSALGCGKPDATKTLVELTEKLAQPQG